MATNIPMFLFFIHIWMISAQETSSDQAVPQKRPHLTGCVSANMETFRCRWNVGTFQNLSEPGNLRLFYINKKITDNEWSECPHYTADRPRECFFNENHTTVWTKYSVRLLSQDETVLYDEDYFLIQDIVRPDPPSGLNWTLLNVGLTGSHFDILVNWKPPESADVQMGWMTLQYEVQYRGVNATLWTVADLEKTTQRSIYGLETNISHEVRVRCKMLGYRYFGNFSESIFISVPSTVSRFPVAILLVFAGLCLVGILMLIVVSQQQKLMIIFLPPIPGPKIRGIDPELLKKGKLLELTSILGDHPDLRPELYNDHWVEFIELDIEEPNDHLTSDADTDCLVDCSPSSSDGTPLSIGFRDDDSGHASCCDPDMPCCDAETLPFHSLLSRRRSSLETSALAADPSSPSLAQNPASAWEWPLVAFPGGREEVYTQVSEVRASGELLLAREEESTADAAAADRGKIKMETEKERIKKGFVQRVNSMNASGYTSELDVGKMNARLSASVDTAGEPFQRGQDASLVAAASQAFGDYQPPYLESSQASARPPLPPPAPVYTVVEGVNTHNSLLLTPNLTPGPPQREVVPKAMPTPEGYLTPDLLGNVTP